ncbi:MAG: hypothetical protein ABI442_18415 [Gemmatimonadaceae bacterium]
MSVLWVAIPDEPGAGSARSVIERNTIALLSNATSAVDQPSPGWLGRHSPRAEIRASGLWNLNYVGGSYDPAYLDLLEAFTSS